MAAVQSVRTGTDHTVARDSFSDCRRPHALVMGVDEAYKALKATPGSAWESIEQTRRQLVQQAHPDCLASMGAEKRAQVQAAARRVNAAYAVLRLVATAN
jgi:DnaJ-domain-containing protein 1